MSNSYPAVPPVETTGTPTGTTSGGGKTGAAKDQAAHLGEKASDAGHQVAGTAKQEASKVASEAKTQAKDLLHSAKGELKDQAASQQQRVATGLHSISDELGSMARNSEQGGVATDLVNQAASKAGDVASWLEARDPGSLLDEVRSFARQRPGTFIALAAVAGVVAGRLTRSIASESSSSGTTPATVGPVYTDPGYTEAGYTEPGFTDPGYADPTLSGQSRGYGATGGAVPPAGTGASLTDDPYIGDARS